MEKQASDKQLIVQIDNLYEKEYKLRKIGEKGFSVTIPKLILKYEAKQRGLSLEELKRKVRGVWKFNHLRGHYLFTFVEEQKTGEAEGKVARARANL